MDVDPIEQSQRHDGSGSDSGKVVAAVEAITERVAAVAKQVAMVVGPSQQIPYQRLSKK